MIRHNRFHCYIYKIFHLCCSTLVFCLTQVFLCCREVLTVNQSKTVFKWKREPSMYRYSLCLSCLIYPIFLIISQLRAFFVSSLHRASVNPPPPTSQWPWNVRLFKYPRSPLNRSFSGTTRVFIHWHLCTPFSAFSIHTLTTTSFNFT